MSTVTESLAQRLARIPGAREQAIISLGYANEEVAEAEALLVRLGIEETDLVAALETLNKLETHDAACLISVEPS